MGLGDAKLMAGVGLLFGWQSIPFILFVSSILGLIFVIPSLLKKQKTMRTEIPFGPFLGMAALIYFLGLREFVDGWLKGIISNFLFVFSQ